MINNTVQYKTFKHIIPLAKIKQNILLIQPLVFFSTSKIKIKWQPISVNEMFDSGIEDKPGRATHVCQALNIVILDSKHSQYH